METKAINIFISYAREDAADRKELEKYLKPMKREGLIDTWYDQDIMAGEEWKAVLMKALNDAQVIIFLVSQNSIASDFIYDIELTTALEKYERKETRIIPIKIAPCELKEAGLDKFMALPKDNKAVSTWGNKAEAWTFVGKAIRRLIENLNGQKNEEKEEAIKEVEPEGLDPKTFGYWVGKGKLDKAIDGLLSYLPEGNDHRNTAILLSGRYNGLMRDLNNGTITREQYSISEARLSQSLLYLINDLK